MNLLLWHRALDCRRILQLASLAVTAWLWWLHGTSPWLLCLAPLIGNLGPWLALRTREARWVHSSVPRWQTALTMIMVGAGATFPVLDIGWLIGLGVSWLLAEFAFWAPGPRHCGLLLVGDGLAFVPSSRWGSGWSTLLPQALAAGLVPTAHGPHGEAMLEEQRALHR